MFPPCNSSYLYPTRLPFEESTIYSQININNPDLGKYPKFKVNINFKIIFLIFHFTFLEVGYLKNYNTQGVLDYYCLEYNMT